MIVDGKSAYFGRDIIDVLTLITALHIMYKVSEKVAVKSNLYI
jgi:hypothetical protein